MKRVLVIVGIVVTGAVGGMIASGIAFAGRNSSGTYTLSTTGTYPFVSGTTISSTTMNGAFSDISTALTDSLSRTGLGGMLAPLRTPDGTVTAPAHAFSNETGTGLYRIGAADLGIAVNQTKRMELTATGVTIPDALTVQGASGLTVTNNATIQGTTGVTLTQGDVVMSEAATQSVTKSGGALRLGTSDAQEVEILRNGAVVLATTSTALDAKSRPIINVSDPTNDQDAATKAWTVTNFVGAGSGYAAGNSGANLDLLGQNDAVPAPSSTWGRLSNRRVNPATSGAPAVPVIIDAATSLAFPLGAPPTWSSGVIGGCYQANGSATFAVTPGAVALTADAPVSATAGAWSSASLLQRLPRVTYVGAAGQAGVRQSAATVWRGSSAGMGGFAFWAEWALDFRDANMDLFVGLAANASALVDPYADTNTAFFGCDDDDTMRVCSNDTSGAATCVDLGANFPCADGVNAVVQYRGALWATPNASSISYAITNITAGQSASGTLSSDLPQNTVQLGGAIEMANSGSSNSVVVIGMCVLGGP